MMSNQDYKNQSDYNPSTPPTQVPENYQPQNRSRRNAYIAGVATVLSILGAVCGGYAVYKLLGVQQASNSINPSPITSSPINPSPTSQPAAPAAPTAAGSFDSSTSPAGSNSPAGSIAASAPTAPIASTAPTAPVPSAPSAPIAGTYETRGTVDNSTFTVRVLELKRVSGNSVLLRLAVTNTGRDNVSLGLLNITRNESVYVVDTQTQQKAYPMEDADGKAIASEPIYGIDPGQTTEIFVQFPNPPATTQQLTIYFPRASSPIADVPITP